QIDGPPRLRIMLNSADAEPAFSCSIPAIAMAAPARSRGRYWERRGGPLSTPKRPVVEWTAVAGHAPKRPFLWRRHLLRSERDAQLAPADQGRAKAFKRNFRSFPRPR